MEMVKVFLTREWSGHEAGETVTVEENTAESMVRKEYGQIVTAGFKRPSLKPKKPRVVQQVNVRLTKDWFGHEAGETVTVEDFTAESMVRKGYGRIVTETGRPVGKRATAQTATAVPKGETTDATPAVSAKAGGKGGD